VQHSYSVASERPGQTENARSASLRAGLRRKEGFSRSFTRP